MEPCMTAPEDSKELRLLIKAAALMGVAPAAARALRLPMALPSLWSSMVMSEEVPLGSQTTVTEIRETSIESMEDSSWASSWASQHPKAWRLTWAEVATKKLEKTAPELAEATSPKEDLASAPEGLRKAFRSSPSTPTTTEPSARAMMERTLKVSAAHSSATSL